MKKKWKKNLLCFILYLLVYLIHKTLKYKIHGKEHLKEAPLLVASWHENSLLGMTTLSELGNFGLLASASSDGELVAQVGRRLGLFSIRGSSSRRGLRAILELGRSLAGGSKIVFAVDGPRGPRREVKHGILFLSHKKKVPIVPMCCKSNSYWTLKKTWDQFRIPKPFSTVTVCFDSPFLASENMDSSSFSLKSKLNELEDSSFSSE